MSEPRVTLVLRITPELYDAIREVAAKMGLSLNATVSSLLVDAVKRINGERVG